MRQHTSAKFALVSVVLAATAAGCASQTQTTAPAAPVTPVVRPSLSVYAYPLHGQPAGQQGRHVPEDRGHGQWCSLAWHEERLKCRPDPRGAAAIFIGESA
jgi:hypothetical protein